MVSSRGSIGEDAPRRAIQLNKYSNIADAFNRLRVSSPVGIFDSQTQYDANPLFWFASLSSTSASITHLPNESSMRLRVTGDEVVIRQTKHYLRYQPGKSQLILCTLNNFQSATGVNKRVGYFDGENGIFLQSDEAGYYFTKRDFITGATVDTKIVQAAWNIDTFNGSGPSKVKLDFTKAQFLVFDLEWLGVGRMRAGFVIDGVIHYSHEFVHANVVNTTYMTTANLPIRYEIVGSGTAAGNNDLVQGCCSVMSEGGFEAPTGIPFSASNNGDSTVVLANIFSPVLALRPATTFNSITNRIQIIPQAITVFTTDENVHYHINYGSNILGGSWSSPSSHSGAEVNLTSTGISGGISVHEEYVAAQTIGNNETGGSARSIITQRLPIALNIEGNHPSTGIRDTICVKASGLSTTATVYATIDWLEIR